MCIAITPSIESDIVSAGSGNRDIISTLNEIVSSATPYCVL